MKFGYIYIYISASSKYGKCLIWIDYKRYMIRVLWLMIYLWSYES